MAASRQAGRAAAVEAAGSAGSGPADALAVAAQAAVIDAENVRDAIADVKARYEALIGGRGDRRPPRPVAHQGAEGVVPLRLPGAQESVFAALDTGAVGVDGRRDAGNTDERRFEDLELALSGREGIVQFQRRNHQIHHA